MKSALLKNLFFQVSFLFLNSFLTAAITHGTLVQTHNGCVEVEHLEIDTNVLSCTKDGSLTDIKIVNIAQQELEEVIEITTTHDVIEVSVDQLFYDAIKNTWIKAQDLDDSATFITSNAEIIKCIAAKRINKKTIAYEITLEEPHVFFIGTDKLLVHNFLPFAVTVSFVFDGLLSGLTFSGVGASLGAFACYKFFDKDNNAVIELNDQNVYKSPVIEAQGFSRDAIFFFNEDQNLNLKDSNDAQAPGMPTENDGYIPPKKWDGKKVKHPKTGQYGYPDKSGKVWVPTGPGPLAHGGPHWDVIYPNGIDYDNVYPGGHTRKGNK